jgi:hypothetical protein
LVLLMIKILFLNLVFHNQINQNGKNCSIFQLFWVSGDSKETETFVACLMACDKGKNKQLDVGKNCFVRKLVLKFFMF